MASLDVYDKPSPIEHVLKDLAQVVMPKKEFRSKAARERRKAKRAAKKQDAKPSQSTRPKSKDGSVTKQSHDADSKTARKTDNENQKKSYLDKIGGASGIAGLAAMGLTLAAVTTMAAEAGIAAVACEDAKVTITSIRLTNNIPEWVPDWEWLRKLIPKPSTVDVTYTVSTSYTPLEGKDSWEFTGTGTELDGGEPKKIIKDLGNKTVRVKCVSKDCSNVTSTTGTVDINCADFSDRMNKAISDAATDAASTIGRATKGFFDGLTSNLPMIILIVVVGLFFFFVVMPLIRR
jgi:hypothetical protein